MSPDLLLCWISKEWKYSMRMEMDRWRRWRYWINDKSSTSYAIMYHDLQNVLNVNHSQYYMELKFLFHEHSTIQIPSIKVTFEVQMKLLIELNQGRKLTLFALLYWGRSPWEWLKDSDAVDHNVDNLGTLWR